MRPGNQRDGDESCHKSGHKTQSQVDRRNAHVFDTTLIADAATGVEDFYSLKQIQTVIRPRSYPLLCQFVTKITIVTNSVCACVKTSAEEEEFQRPPEGGSGDVSI